ncbi:MAG: dockerin type I repeat-containing protein, partial [Oscillospiraceae bacterium]|nr:dockerin type I repeat-containing protein [Oscillospiraceae bacterium]
DAIISDHMGIRKIMHFVHVGMTEDGLTGYQVVRGALKGFNTGWSNYTGDDDGYYKNYPDEIISLARWYYEEGHLYDNAFTWTNDERVNAYRQGNVWEWWGDGQPSLDEIQTTEANPEILLGDVNLDGIRSIADVVLMQKYLAGKEKFSTEQYAVSDMNQDNSTNIYDYILLKRELLK